MSAHNPASSLHFAQLSTNYSSSPPSQPPRASFDDDRDLDDQLARLRKLSMLTVDSGQSNHFSSRKNSQNCVDEEGGMIGESLQGVILGSVAGGNDGGEGFDGDEEEEEDEVEIEKRWFAFEVADCPPSLKFLVRFFRFFLFSFSGIVFTTTSAAEAANQNSKFAAKLTKLTILTKNGGQKLSDHSSVVKPNHHLHNNNHNLQFPPPAESRRASSSVSKTSAVGPSKAFKFNRTLVSRAISTWTLFANVVMILSYMMPMLVGPLQLNKEAQTWGKLQENFQEAVSKAVSFSGGGQADPTGNLTEGESSNSTSINLETFGIHEFFGSEGDEDYWEEFMHLKPILRNLTKSAVYIFMCDALFQFAFNLLLGGRLVGRIARLPGLAEVDRDRKLAYQLLAGAFTIIGGTSLAGLCIFNQKQLKTLVELVVHGRTGASSADQEGIMGGDGVDEEEVAKLTRTWLVVAMHQYHYFILAMVSVLFVYTMITCRRILDSMREEVSSLEESRTGNSSTLTEAHLEGLKRRLTVLAGHLSGIVSCLGLPITTVMLSNALLIIGSFCFLLIHKLKEDDYFVVFIFNLGAFAFCRLVLLCAWGNALTTGHRELVRAIYEAVAEDEWTLPKWMAFLEIKRLAGRFEVNIGGVYSVKQSAILTVLGFALNYIVVLLQTETYGSGGQLQQQTAASSLNLSSGVSWGEEQQQPLAHTTEDW